MKDPEDETDGIVTDVIVTGKDVEEVGAEALVVDLVEVEAEIVLMTTIAQSSGNVLTNLMTAQSSLHAQIETDAAAVIEAAVVEASREVAEAIEAKNVSEVKSENDVGIEVEVEKSAALGIDGKAALRNQRREPECNILSSRAQHSTIYRPDHRWTHLFLPVTKLSKQTTNFTILTILNSFGYCQLELKYL